METIRFRLPDLPKKIDRLTICLGNFDGLHKGHYRLVRAALLEAEGPSAIMLFDSDPRIHERFGKGNEVISSIEDRIRIADSYGLDYCIVVEADESFYSLNKDEFIDKVLLPLGVNHVVVGEDFRFGYKAEGDASYLKSRLKTDVVSLLEENGRKVSSTDIKSLIKEGRIEEANQMLGRSYTVRGKVVEGFHNGKKLDFPTANLKLSSNYVVPRFGVYLTVAYVYGKPYLGVTNVGINPTIGEITEPIIETHLIGLDEDIYGTNMELCFLAFERPETKFSSLEELKDRISKDKAWAIEKAKELRTK